MATLQAQNIVAGYSDVPVVRDVSITVAPGEFVGLIGPNGCGKSTLLRVLSRVLKPSSGSVRLDGEDLQKMPAREIARRMAFVPQEEPAAFDFSVRSVVMMGRYPHQNGIRADRADDYEIVERAMREADVLNLADRPITQLSGGEHRRVLLARALAQKTPLLLLDEPAAHLDISHQEELLQLLLSLAKDRGTAVLAALHDLNQAAAFADTLVLMRDGAVIAAGAPAEVLTPHFLAEAYDADAEVGLNPVTQRPMVLAIRSRRTRFVLEPQPVRPTART